jgi:GntR family transcriptional regulator/MocR family aminotransferase
VIVVNGSQQALDLAARVLLDPGDAVWLEEPGYLGARAALVGAAARIVPVPLDREGLSVTEGERDAPSARMVCVTPSHQYPTGVTMSAGRRLSLLQWAARADAWILEDDYDSDFRYASRPLACLQGMDAGGRVVYIGTFSKTLFPALRLGYLIVPLHVAGAFRAARAVCDRHSPTIDQAVLADFIGEGHFGRHVRRMRALYEERQVALVDAGRALEGLIDIRPAEAGLHLVGWLPPGVSDRPAAAALKGEGVEALAFSPHYIRSTERDALLLGYAAFDSAGHPPRGGKDGNGAQATLTSATGIGVARRITKSASLLRHPSQGIPRLAAETPRRTLGRAPPRRSLSSAPSCAGWRLPRCAPSRAALFRAMTRHTR